MSDLPQSLHIIADLITGQRPAGPAYADGPISDELVEIARREGVLPLLYEKSRQSGPELWPDDQAGRIRAEIRMLAAGELQRKKELIRVLDAFGSENLPYLLLKGTPLAYRLYPQAYLRVRSDTDILFADRETAELAWQLLQQQGYRRPLVISGKYISHEFCAIKREGQAEHILDMHWRLSNRHFFAEKLAYDELQQQAIPVPALHPGAFALDDIHALVHACIHRVAHYLDGQANRLLWLYDIHLLASGLEEPQWQRFLAQAKTKHLCDICLQGLELAVDYFATRVPAQVVAELAAGSADGEPLKGIRNSRIRMELANLRAVPGLGGKLGLIREHVFPDREYMRGKYQVGDSAWLPYYYLRRIVGSLPKLFH